MQPASLNAQSARTPRERGPSRFTSTTREHRARRPHAIYIFNSLI
jgi:hypothetical protein